MAEPVEAALVARVHDCPDCTHAKPEPEPPALSCDWFQWFGNPNCCDGCGNPMDLHLGIEWLAPGAGPFTLGPDTIKVEWKDYGPGRVLNVPMLTALFREGTLEYLQGAHAKASEGGRDERA